LCGEQAAVRPEKVVNVGGLHVQLVPELLPAFEEVTLDVNEITFLVVGDVKGLVVTG